MDLRLKLSTQLTVGRVTNHPTCHVTVAVEGENKSSSVKIENISRYSVGQRIPVPN